MEIDLYPIPGCSLSSDYSASLISSLTPASWTLFLLALPSLFQAVCVVSLAELWGRGFFLILQSKALKFVGPLLG